MEEKSIVSKLQRIDMIEAINSTRKNNTYANNDNQI
jgi:hypothetical protein